MERDIKNPEGSGLWVLIAALYRLREGARNWYDRFYRHCVGLGFTPAHGDPAAYNYDRDGAHGSPAIHVDDTLTAGNTKFYDKDLTRPDLVFMISILSCSSSKK